MKKTLSTLLLSLTTLVGFNQTTVLAWNRNPNGVSTNDAINWARRQVGKGYDLDGRNGPQCVELISQFAKEKFKKEIWGNAINLKDLNLKGWEVRDSRYRMEPGDIAIWDHGQFGHTGIVVHVNHNTGNFHSVDQNYNSPNPRYGGPATVARDHSIHHRQWNRSYWGFIRPPYTDAKPIRYRSYEPGGGGGWDSPGQMINMIMEDQTSLAPGVNSLDEAE